MVDTDGRVIGMDTAAGSSFTFETSVNRGYAIPIDHALGIAQKIVAGQRSTAIHIGATAFMGISVQDGDNFCYNQSGNGVVVAQIVPGSPIAHDRHQPGRPPHRLRWQGRVEFDEAHVARRDQVTG